MGGSSVRFVLIGGDFVRDAHGYTTFFWTKPSVCYSEAYSKSPPSMAETHVEVPAQTQQIVLKLLAKEPVDRYQSAEELVQALNGVASSGFVLPDDEQRDVHRKVMRPQFVGRESEMEDVARDVARCTGWRAARGFDLW